MCSLAGCNYLAVLVAAVAHWLLGGLWYSVVFKNAWMAEMGLSAEAMKGPDAAKKGMKAMLIGFFVGFIMVCTLSALMKITGMITLRDAAVLAATLWFGFIATTTFNGILYEGKSLKLWLINNGYQLAGLLLAAGILAYVYI